MRRFLFSFLLFFVSAAAFAVGKPVFDFERTVVESFSAANEMDEMVEQTGNMLRLFKLSKEQLEKWEEVKKKMEVVSDFVGSVEDLDRCYRTMEKTYELLRRAEEVILDDDWLDVSSRLSYFNSVLSDCQYNISFVSSMIEKYSSGSVYGGRMTDFQREKLKLQDFIKAENANYSARSKIDGYLLLKDYGSSLSEGYRDAADAAVFDF